MMTMATRRDDDDDAQPQMDQTIKQKHNFKFIYHQPLQLAIGTKMLLL